MIVIDFAQFAFWIFVMQVDENKVNTINILLGYFR